MKKIFLMAAAALALVACDNNDDTPTASPVAAKIYASIGESVSSRASDQSWAKGDAIGISSTVAGSVGPYVNVKYITEGGDGEFTGNPLYFYKPMTLIAYYPYREGTAPFTDGFIEAITDSANQKTDKQPAFDFLWDSQSGFTAKNPEVEFKFTHRMSKLTFIFLDSADVIVNDIKIADGVSVSTMVNYTIDGLVLKGSFNTANGECAVKADEVVAELPMNVKNVENGTAVSPLILFPQTLKEGYAILHVYTDELHNLDALQHYYCRLMFSDGEIKPGYHYQYTIQVTKIGLIVGTMTIERWEEEDRFMTATIDGEDVFKEQN